MRSTATSSVNDVGTAVLFQALIDHPVQRVVVASSMSIYGEGLYRTAAGERAGRRARPARAPGAGWDPVDAGRRAARPGRDAGVEAPDLASVYALTKYAQERLTLTVAPAYGMEGVALRLFNVYGPGQALSNPYTGVLAIFASRLLNRERPLVFEDGEQRRDFVHVEDVARAFVLALEQPEAAGQVFNIGSGRDVSILQVGDAIARAMGAAAPARRSWWARRAPATSGTASPTSPWRATCSASARAAASTTASASWRSGCGGSRRRTWCPRAEELEQRGLVA